MKPDVYNTCEPDHESNKKINVLLMEISRPYVSLVHLQMAKSTQVGLFCVCISIKQFRS